MPKKKEVKPAANKTKRPYIKQTDIPSAPLADALRIPRAILDEYAGEPTTPLKLGKALELDPKGSQLKLLCGAAIAYGLTAGGAQAQVVSITPLAKRILRPVEEEDDVAASREAILKPRVFGEFLRKYDQHPLPRPEIARNVLVDLGVPEKRADEVLSQLEASATSAGFIEEIKGRRHVDLSGVAPPRPESEGEDEASSTEGFSDEEADPPLGEIPAPLPRPLVPKVEESAFPDTEARSKRVFITHGKNKALIEPIKKLLEYGELEPVVSVEKSSVSKPVPEKVMSEMRSCGAAIIHVEAESVATDDAGTTHVIINPNVLIEIGAAMAFYGRRFILLVRDGTRLPSNLQGLYEVRYSEDALDSDATIRLLEAMKDIKNHPLPGGGS